MRNLKKFLALILAFMMAFSLMVTVNAAVVEDGNVTFGDEEKVEESFVEDLTVLAGMGVIKGYSPEEFGPQRPVTRAEMAAIVYRLVTGDAGKGDYQDKSKLYADYGDFTDVVPTDWYAGYIGYCANAAIIVGYGDGTFGPNDPVTGHQALVMLLRAMGYNQPEEFTKADWRQKAASIATQRNLLDKVNDTIYKGNLAANANREVIAEITFQAATHAQVQYTAAFGYQTTLLNTNTQLTTLGYDNFGLTDWVGIVVGNQATGEKTTKVGFTNGNLRRPDANAYNYWSVVNQNTTHAFNWDTSLKDFGHKVHVWFDVGSNEAKGLTTYAMFDRVEKVVLTDAIDDSVANYLAFAATDDGAISDVAKGEGFSVTSGITHWNYSFGPMSANNFDVNGEDLDLNGDGTAADSIASPILETDKSADTHPLYLLISNDSVNTNLDMVVALDMTITRISQQNDVGSIKSVGVQASNDSAKAGIPGTNHYFGVAADVGTSTDKNYINIAQSHLVGDSVKTLGKRVAAIEVVGTAGTTKMLTAATAGYGDVLNDGNAEPATDPGDGMESSYYYQLSELTNVKKFTVTSRNEATQSVKLSDGTVLERSPLALATDASFLPRERVEAPTVYGEYNFTLDENGKYIFWEPIVGTTRFVYGTYVDYQSTLGSSTYTYPLIGVGIDGQRTQDNVISYTNPAGDTELDEAIDFNGNSGANYEASPLIKRDAGTVGSGGWQKGMYVGYLIDEDGNLGYLENSLDRNAVNTTGVYQADTDNFGQAGGIKIESGDAALGVKYVGTSGDDALYLTQNTQFYIVKGAGTDTQEVTAVKGLTELLKGKTSVTIDGDSAITTDDYVETDPGEAYEMIYFTQSPFTYAQDYATTAYQVDTVIIPAACTDSKAASTTSLVFVGNKAETLRNNTGTKATQFTMYKDGVEGKYWIMGLVGTEGDDANTIDVLGHNVFYNLVATNKKANDGETIYKIAKVDAMADKLIGCYFDGDTATKAYATMSPADADKKYVAATKDSQIALINTKIGDEAVTNNPFNVASAKVKNLDTKNFPGITNLETLNAASSLETNDGITVSCVTGSNRIVSLIYVDYVPAT